MAFGAVGSSAGGQGPGRRSSKTVFEVEVRERRSWRMAFVVQVREPRS